MNQIPERDWKALRPIKNEAMARFCHRSLGEVRRLIDDPGAGGSEHERYLAVHRAVIDNDRRVERMFDGFRRSTAILQLATWVAAGLVTDIELAALSDHTNEIVHQLLKFRRGSEAEPAG